MSDTGPPAADDRTDDDAEPGQPGIPVEWALDAAIGAASTAGRLAAAVGRSVPGRLATAATRFVGRPFAEEGHGVRERAAPVVKEMVQGATPGVVEAVDINEILAAIDLNALLADVDIDALVGRIDVGAIVAKVDIGAIVDQIDIDAIVGEIDIDAIVQRVDIGEILDRIDLNEVIARVDVDSLLQETELGSIIAKSTSGFASEALDGVRRQGVSLDNVVGRISNRLVRRDVDALPKGPPLLTGPERALPPGSNDSGPAEAALADAPATDAPDAGTAEAS